MLTNENSINTNNIQPRQRYINFLKNGSKLEILKGPNKSIEVHGIIPNKTISQ